jgi:hypothetical protein
MVEFLRGLDTRSSSQEHPATAMLNENQSAATLAPKTLSQLGFSLWTVCLILMVGLVGLKVRSMRLRRGWIFSKTKR